MVLGTVSGRAVYGRSLAAPKQKPAFLGASQSAQVALFLFSRHPPNPRSCLCGVWSPKCPQKNCSGSMLTSLNTFGISWVTGWRTSPGESWLPHVGPPGPPQPTFPFIRFSSSHFKTWDSLFHVRRCRFSWESVPHQTMRVDMWSPPSP